jgi:hypothetical protein
MGIPDLGGTFLTQNVPPDNVIEVRCRPISTKYLHLNPLYLLIFPRIERRKVYLSLRVEGGLKMKKDGVTLKSHDLRGYGVLKRRFQFFSFIFMCLLEGDYVAFGGIVVIVLAIGPKVRGLKPGRGQWIFKEDKNP